MQTYLLQPKDIKKITGQSFYTRGKHYYDTGKVYGLSHNSAIRSWRAVVAGTHDYEVRIFFFEDDDVEATCECPAYHTYYTCKHIAAVLIAIREKALEELSPKLAERSIRDKQTTSNHDRLFAMRLYETFRERREQTQSEDLKKPLSIQYQLHVQSLLGTKSLSVELKMGESYLYVIKDIRELLEYMQKKQAYRITKKFTYDPSEHTLDEKDQKITKLLHDAFEQEHFYDQQWNYSDKKRLKLSPLLAQELLPLLAEKEAFVMERGEYAGYLAYKPETPNFSFYISEERGLFHMHMSHLKEYEYFADYHLLYKDATFYAIDREKEGVLETLYSLLPYNSNGNHTVSHFDMEGIVSHVLPELETVADVQLDASASEKIVQEDLKAKVYLDFQSWTLTVDVKFHYGDVTIDPFKNQEQSQTIIRRDSATEQAIMQIIEAAEFKFDGDMVYIEDEEELEAFLYEYMPMLKEKADVYLSSSVRSMLEQSDQELRPSVQMESDGSWLDISFTIDGIKEDDISAALRAAIERKKYYRLSDGALLSLTTESFERFQRLADELDLSASDVSENGIHVSQARSLQVENVLNPEEKERDARFTQLVERLKNPQTLEVDPPLGLHADLRPYQLTGFRWMKTLATYGLGGILADDMGLGKTLQTISFLLYEKENGEMNHPALIIAPASLLYNWKKEVEKFAPRLAVRMISGDKFTRQEAIESKEEADVWITSYPLIRQDAEFYKELKFHAMVLDESQAIKNETTKTAAAVRTIRAQHRFALSGTPIENSLTELWSIFRTLMPGFYTSKKKFLQMKPEKVARMTRPFILRRMKKEVLDELPDKIDTVQYSELTREQKEVYLAYLERIQNDIEETIATKGIQRGKLEILAGLTRLRQICCHPSLFLENYEGDSGKLEQLKELAQELKDSGHRLLIFSQFSSMLKILHEELAAIGLDAFYLDGSTKSEHRMEMVEQFNEGEKDAFFISLKAGGTGLNLTGADTVILYDLWWNPAIEEQAAGRAHRIGQERVVQVIRMISEGTIEERIYQLQQKKRDLVDQVIQPGESMITSLSEEEIRNLFE
ncbi:DEAD/DEAH box helicase [Halobacillus litoralis]|uniref:DEAD/DEAH box helicase n=1 Tax=Halobacillus litoralis TaxID=45668 RepID=UPI001CD7D517|nr:DEAD/DEAH box helicase [Halobacillus litoralis]MCA0971618.1 DEAD/DEAH box helicase [Halobacillus litoralis]